MLSRQETFHKYISLEGNGSNGAFPVASGSATNKQTDRQTNSIQPERRFPLGRLPNEKKRERIIIIMVFFANENKAFSSHQTEGATSPSHRNKWDCSMGLLR